MDEPRDTPAQPGTRRPAVVAAGTRLSPLQEAYGEYTAHTLECPRCRALDGGPCDDSQRLRHAYLALGGDAYRALNGESA
ncbi:hypothetical protein ABZ876_08585 [Streptomyces sp. NPDC046931]|uniref:hypothetical protein n=1 Tax=Streptomyces sp. NPDC046931 TaxID=3154806 RepID=UPI0033F539AA